MAHVSKKKLNTKVLDALYARLAGTMTDLGDMNSANAFLDDLLTPTEKLMLAKRLAVIFMLEEGVSTYKVQIMLGISPSTARRLQLQSEQGVYDQILTMYRKKRQRKAFWDGLEKVLMAGLPPRGRGRWRWFYEMMDEAEVAQKRKK